MSGSAMHPLLDVHGKNGRQLVWKGHDGGEKRLAWVHTLCAGLIAGNRATASCVYGKFLISTSCISLYTLYRFHLFSNLFQDVVQIVSYQTKIPILR